MSNNPSNYILSNKEYIENRISYTFRNQNLLVQAFTRKSFSQENSNFANNEILEFYGDQIVNFVMTKWLFDSFSYEPNYNHFYESEKDESELTNIRAKYVKKETLSHCISVLGLEEFLLLGKSDETNQVWKNDSVKEDLFEAIIGAIAIDSQKNDKTWDLEVLTKSCKAMWGMLDFNEDYISKIFDFCNNNNLTDPQFSISKTYDNNNKYHCRVNIYLNYEWLKGEGSGNSEIVAKMNAASKLLDEIDFYQMKKIAGNFTFENSVSKLNILYQKKFICEPIYKFYSPNETKNGIWRCECFIDDYKNYEGYLQSGIGEENLKADAKRAAAYSMLRFIFD